MPIASRFCCLHKGATLQAARSHHKTKRLHSKQGWCVNPRCPSVHMHCLHVHVCSSGAERRAITGTGSAVTHTRSSMSLFFQLHSELQAAIFDLLDFRDR